MSTSAHESLLIDGIDIFHVAMPLLSPFVTAYGRDDVVHSVLVRLSSNKLIGWGESCPLQYPTYSPEWAGGVFAMLRDVAGPLILGRNIESGQELGMHLAHIRGNQFAKAALDLAWWDLHAHRTGMPLWQLIGGLGGKVDVGADFGAAKKMDDLLEDIAAAISSGFKRIKLKYRPGWDLDMIATVRAAFPKVTLHIDCNGAYSLADLAMFVKLDRYGLAMIEQPLAYDDLVDHAELQRCIVTPICLDESITSVSKVRKAIQLKSCRWINLKPARVAGLTNALEIHELCGQHDMPCWIGGMLESALGAAFLTALATLPQVKYPSDIFPSRRFYRRDLSDPETQFSGPAQITPSVASGVGCEPNADELERLTVEHVSLRL